MKLQMCAPCEIWVLKSENSFNYLRGGFMKDHIHASVVLPTKCANYITINHFLSCVWVTHYPSSLRPVSSFTLETPLARPKLIFGRRLSAFLKSWNTFSVSEFLFSNANGTDHTDKGCSITSIQSKFVLWGSAKKDKQRMDNGKSCLLKWYEIFATVCTGWPICF